MGRRQYRVLELRGRLSRAETADGPELFVRTHRGQRRGLQHPAAGPDEGKRTSRVARQTHHAPESLSHTTPGAARRVGRSPDRRVESTRLSTAERCWESSRGLSEHSERYPRSTLTPVFTRLRRAGIRCDLSYRGLRASRFTPV